MEKAILAGVCTDTRRKNQAEESMEELKTLTISAGAKVEKMVLQNRDKIDPKYYIGKGKIEEIVSIINKYSTNVIIFDDKLSPAQFRNLENKLKIKVLDRTQLILDIFAQRARSNEGKLQVELAQLLYLLPRLTGKGEELSRLGGGIGTRGPGEKQLEYERRRIRDRIARIKDKLKDISKKRSLHRNKRKKSPIPFVSLAGYTSAGKTTLFNTLTEEEYKVSDKLFSTLDAFTRKVSLKSGLSFFISDTVGFIKKLPVELIESFKSTLDEMVYSDLIIHIIDYSRDDYQKQMSSVRNTLEQIGASQKNIINVFNKIDLIKDGKELVEKNKIGENSDIYISAVEGWGIDDLLKVIENKLFADYKFYKIRVKKEYEDMLKSINKWGFILKRYQIGDYSIYEVCTKYKHMLKFLPKLSGKGELL